MADQDNSLRDDLMAAAADVEDTPEGEVSEVEETAAPETEEETPQEVSGEEQQSEPADPPAEPEPVIQSSPPVDWAPEVKEQWAKLDPALQNAISDRERHINETLQDTAGIRNEYDNFNQMIQPYIPMMQAEGATDAMIAVKGLLDTTAGLMLGSQAQKAQRIAGLIQHYGIDIEVLDGVLAGEPGQDPAATRFEQMLDQRMAPVNQLLQQVNQGQAEQQQQLNAEVGDDIFAFSQDPKNLHFGAVRGVMADFLDMASQRGTPMTLEDAYQRACLADPNIAPLVTQQFAQQAAQGHQAAVGSARNAAGSVVGKPAGGSSSGLTEDMSLRETIEAQFGGGGRI
jgi:hypothetical protein